MAAPLSANPFEFNSRLTDDGEVPARQDPEYYEALLLLREHVIRALGVDLCRGLLYGYGEALGAHDAAALGRPFSWENDSELLLASPRLIPWLGAAMKPRRVMLSRARGACDIEVELYRSVEGEHHQQRFGAAEHAVCWGLCGYYAGYASSLLGQPVSVRETTCIGMGAPQCTLRLRTGEAERPRAILEVDHAARLLDAELRALQKASAEKVRRLEALREAVLDICAELRLYGVQAKIVSRGRVLVQARHAFLVMTKDAAPLGRGGFDVVHDGLSPEQAAALEPFPLDVGLFAAVLRDGTPLRLRRATDDPRAWLPRDPSLASLSGSFLAVPLLVHGAACGALYFVDPLHGGVFSEDDQRLIEHFAAHAAAAVENAVRVEELRREVEVRDQQLQRELMVTAELHARRRYKEPEEELLRALVEFADWEKIDQRAPAAGLSHGQANGPSSGAIGHIDSALHEVLKRLLALVDGDAGALLLTEPGASKDRGALTVRAVLVRDAVQTRSGVERGLMPLAPPAGAATGLSLRALGARELQYVRDVIDDEDALGQHLRARGLRSLLALPLQVDGRVIGTLEVGTYEVRTFDDAAVRGLRAAVKHAALAIEHARARQLLKAVIEAAPIGMSVWLPGAEQAMLANRVLRDLEDKGRALGMDPAGDAPQRALRGEEVAREERALPGSGGDGDGSLFLRVSAAPVRDGEGPVQAAVAVVEELTLEKELERLRERFVSLVAHDLRTPLQAAQMHLELLRERLEAGQGTIDQRGAPARLLVDSLRSTDAIQLAMDRVGDLVRDLLDYSRLEAGQLTVNPAEIGLLGLVRRLLEEQRPLLQGRMVEVDIDDDLPPLRADQRRLSQVLVNLLANAVKYTAREVRLGLRARRADAALVHERLGATGDFALVTVWDQGPGIPAEARGRLFDPFYRLQRDADKREGTGLGLYISRGLCQAHGGALWIDDVQGASFSMLWPTGEKAEVKPETKPESTND